METVLWCVLTFVVSGALCGFVAGFISFKKGIAYRKQVAEGELGSAEEQAKRILEDAKKDASSKKKEALIEAKDEIHKLRLEADRDIKERRNEANRMERRLQQKEETLDRKLDNFEKKEEILQNKIKTADKKLEEAEVIKTHQMEMLDSRLSPLGKRIVDQPRTELAADIRAYRDALPAAD